MFCQNVLFVNEVKYVYSVKFWFLFQVSSCEAYYEAMHVESIWQVSPLDALVETLSDVCFKPLAGLGMGISAYFNAVIGTTPFWWTPVVLILSFGLLTVLIMCLMRYRISSPFFSIEPHTSNIPRAQVFFITILKHQFDYKTLLYNQKMSHR